ncbi:MAG: hypothetical protein QM652_09280 [Legionella sp.]|uniref:hypothetical protein n=1 Tax=Legionella sp. TaxID=459 RepID=UPI0039E2837C
MILEFFSKYVLFLNSIIKSWWHSDVVNNAPPEDKQVNICYPLVNVIHLTFGKDVKELDLLKAIENCMMNEDNKLYINSNLCYIKFQKSNWENKLPKIIGIGIRLKNLQDMTPEQRKAFASAFPNIKELRLFDGLGGTVTIENVQDIKILNIWRDFGFNTPVPSLLTQSSIFIKQNKTVNPHNKKQISMDNIEDAEISETLIEHLKSLPSK